jgi:hypothetical protein
VHVGSGVKYAWQYDRGWWWQHDVDGPLWARGGGQEVGGGLVRCAGVDGVDGHLGGRQAHDGTPAHEALGMSGLGHVESELAGGSEFGDAPEEHVCGCEQSEARVTVLMRVPLTR